MRTEDFYAQALLAALPAAVAKTDHDVTATQIIAKFAHELAT